VLRANYAFRAVFVPAGAHDVRFVYRPTSVLAGAAVSFAALAVCLVLGAAALASSRRARGHALSAVTRTGR
jgi:hypothetical protein